MSDTSTAETEAAPVRGRQNGEAAPRQTREAQLNWDDQKMQTTFANVVNIQSTREQVDLFFGTNQTWSVPNDRRVQVELSNRIILSPHAAKRLSVLLDNVLREYENRFGSLPDPRG